MILICEGVIMEYPSEVLAEEYEYQQVRRYESHLAAHPHRMDPDHPDPFEYGIEEEDD